jgi:hypothetical protein
MAPDRPGDICEVLKAAHAENLRLRGALMAIALREREARESVARGGPSTLAIDLCGMARRALEGEDLSGH